MAEDYEVGNKKPPRIHQFGGKEANPQGNGPETGVRYFKPALKRYARDHPEAVDEIAAGLFEDARGLTKVDVAVHVGNGETAVEQVRIPVADRQRAAMLLRDTMDGKPVQEIDVAGAPTTTVIIAHATGALDPKLSKEIAAIVEGHEEETAEAVDLDTPHPTEEEEPDEPED